MVTDESDLTIVRSIIDLSHNLGLDVVAEGVEDADTLERLAEMGCDRAQGYFMSRPVPSTEMLAWMADESRRAESPMCCARRGPPLARDLTSQATYVEVRRRCYRAAVQSALGVVPAAIRAQRTQYGGLPLP